MMQIIINSLDYKVIDRLICQDSDMYARIIRPDSEEDPTVDVAIHIKTFAVDSEHLIIEFPNNSVLAINLPSFHYHTIEVL